MLPKAERSERSLSVLFVLDGSAEAMLALVMATEAGEVVGQSEQANRDDTPDQDGEAKECDREEGALCGRHFGRSFRQCSCEVLLGFARHRATERAEIRPSRRFRSARGLASLRSVRSRDAITERTDLGEAG